MLTYSEALEYLCEESTNTLGRSEPPAPLGLSAGARVQWINSGLHERGLSPNFVETHNYKLCTVLEVGPRSCLVQFDDDLIRAWLLGHELHPVPYAKIRMGRLTMPGTIIRAHKPLTVGASPLVPFKPLFLVVPANIAKRVRLLKVTSGVLHVFEGELCLERFSSAYWAQMLAKGDDLRAIPEVFRFEGPFLNPHDLLTMQLKNCSDYDEDFTAEWLGEELHP